MKDETTALLDTLKQRREDTEAARMLQLIGVAQRHETGRLYKIEHDDFVGRVIGYYVTDEDKPGVVLQQEGTKVVHVYGEKWLK